MHLESFKFQSYGNDFLIVPARQVRRQDHAKLARMVCDRHFGIGADGCILVGEQVEEKFPVWILNRDGSQAEMSGNGVRCVCAFLHRQAWTRQPRVLLKTADGERELVLLEEKQPVWKYRANMGVPRFSVAEIPFVVPENQGAGSVFELEAAGRPVRVMPLNVGNPQCVVFVSEFPSDEAFRELGRALETHPSFPRRTNVSFVRVRRPHKIQIKIWERGVGPTFSSGTGCCGAAVASICSSKVESPVEVDTETGVQQVEWHPGGPIHLTGEATYVAEVRFFWSPEF